MNAGTVLPLGSVRRRGPTVVARAAPVRGRPDRVHRLLVVFAIASGTNYAYTEDGADPTCRRSTRRTSRTCSASACPSRPRSSWSGRRWVFRVTCYYYRKAYYRSFFFAAARLRRRRAEAEAATAARRRSPFVLQNAHRYFLYLAPRRARLPLGTTPAARSSSRRPDGSLEFGIGLGSLVLLGNVVFLSAFTLRLQLAAPPRRREPRLLHVLRVGARAALALAARHVARTCCHMEWAWISLVGVGARRPLRPARGAPSSAPSTTRASSEWPRPRDSYEHDVLVIGAGGAGLRATIAAAAAGLESASSVSRCSARRTQSWPRVGSPERWRTWTKKISGRSTSWTRCAAAFLNNWRTAEIQAKEAPERVLELEQ